jgi:predicted N-acetyltransferase YhbS
MTRADFPLGQRLVAQAGWNQTEADWARFLDIAPGGAFVAELDGVPAATIVTCEFGMVAWIAMVVVEISLRGRGLAKALVAHGLEFLDARGVRTIRLDATALGQPLYERLGFDGEYELERFEGVPVAASVPPTGCIICSFHRENLAEMVALDRRAAGADRRKLLARLAADETTRLAIRDGAVEGFVMSRSGRRAVQIGPCIGTAEAGACLLADAWLRYRGQPVSVDIPAVHATAGALARSQGLLVARRFLRMCRGERVREHRDLIWASSGPELG